MEPPTDALSGTEVEPPTDALTLSGTEVELKKMYCSHLCYDIEIRTVSYEYL